MLNGLAEFLLAEIMQKLPPGIGVETELDDLTGLVCTISYRNNLYFLFTTDDGMLSTDSSVVASVGQLGYVSDPNIIKLLWQRILVDYQ